MKKSKIALLGTLAGVSAVIPALTTVSCGSKQTTNRVGDNYDKEYGVDEAVFTKLKNSFPKAVEKKMEGKDPKEIARAVNNARNMCDSFDRMFRQRNDLSYTTITSALIEYAARAYDVKLVREFSRKAASFDELDEAFNGMKDSMDSYMQASGVLSPEERIRILDEAQDGYDALKEKLTDETNRKYDDPLLAVTQAKGELFKLFADVNEDIGLLASANRLKDFLSTHKVEYEFSETNDANKLDTLEQNVWFKEGADLSIDSRILQIFTITREGEDTPMTEFNPETVCPGYTIRPILKKINKDAKTNEYSLDIDWTATKTSYLEAGEIEKAERTTAHYYNGTSKLDLTDKTSAYNILKGANDDAFIRYPIYLTKQGERDALTNAYFNASSEDGNITFDWDNDAEKNAFEALFSGAKVNKDSNDGDYEYIIDNDALAKAGLKIKWNGTVNNDEPDPEKDPVTEGRLSDFIAINSPRIEHDVENNITDLMKEFLDNCSTWAYVKPGSTKSAEDKYSSTNTVYVDYTNTKYATYDKDNVANSVEVLDGKFDNLFQVSQEAYDYLTSEFNQQMDFLEDYTKNEYQDEYKAANDDVVLESIMFSLTVLFTAQTTAMCWVPVFAGHLPLYIVLLTISWISMGGQTAILSLLVDKKLKPLEKLKDECEEVKNSSSLKNLINKVKKSQQDNFLCRYNDNKEISAADYWNGFNNFKTQTDFFEDILPAMEFYQHIGKDGDYRDFLKVLQDHDITPEDYDAKMNVWDSNGVCTKVNWGLIGSTFALDMASLFLLGECPEMTDWQLVKAVAADARASGKSIKSMFPIYKQLKQIKGNIAKITTTLEKVGQGSLKALDGVSHAEALNLLRVSAIFASKGKYMSVVDKLEGVAPEALKLLNQFSKNFVVKIDSFGAGAKNMLELVKENKCGMTVLVKALVTDCKGNITQAGKQILDSVFTDLTKLFGQKAALSKKIMLGDRVYDLIHTGIKSEEILGELERIANYGMLALRQGLPSETLRSLKEFETILFDSENWIKSIDIALEGCSSRDIMRLIGYVQQSAGLVYEDILKGVIEGTKFIIG